MKNTVATVTIDKSAMISMSVSLTIIHYHSNLSVLSCVWNVWLWRPNSVHFLTPSDPKFSV